MRAGPLSNKNVIATLNADFVNTWILRKDLIALTENADGELLAFAKRVLEQFEYPVDNIVFDTKGAYVGHIPANSPGSKSVPGFLELLRRAKSRGE